MPPVLADNNVSITMSSSESTLDHAVTADELLGEGATFSNYRIRRVIEISNNSMKNSVYAFVNSTVLPLSQGTAKFYVNLSGTIGSAPISTNPTLINFNGKQAQIDIAGIINSASLNLYLKPGAYAGTLVITTNTL